MKKKVTLIALVLIVVSLFLAIKFNGGTETIEEAINTSGSKRVSIIHFDIALIFNYSKSS